MRQEVEGGLHPNSFEASVYVIVFPFQFIRVKSTETTLILLAAILIWKKIKLLVESFK